MFVPGGRFAAARYFFGVPPVAPLSSAPSVAGVVGCMQNVTGSWRLVSERQIVVVVV